MTDNDSSPCQGRSQDMTRVPQGPVPGILRRPSLLKNTKNDRIVIESIMLIVCPTVIQC
jgi:hypothetical protein